MVAVRAALVAVAPGVPDGDPVVERDPELVGEVPVGTTAAVGLDVGLIPVAGAGPDDPVVRVVMMGIVRVGRSVMMTGRRVVRVVMMGIVRVGRSVMTIGRRVVRVVMMGIVRVGRSVMTTGRRGKNESPAPKLNVAAGK